jgi:hypothetical protein
MNIKFYFLICLVFITINAEAAGGAHLTGVKGTLKNAEKAIKSAVSKAEELYEQNGGASRDAPVLSLLDLGNSPFLQILDIGTLYEVYIVFAGTPGEVFMDNSDTGSGATIPVAQVLRGATIKLVPIFNPGDAVISSWECLTDADKNVVAFMGASSASTVGNISFISTNGNNGTNEYLSNCIYIDPSS